MTEFLFAVALFLLVMIALGLWRVLRGPTPGDRMLSAQLFGTTGIAVILVLSVATRGTAGFDVAIVFALLAVLTVLAFSDRPLQGGTRTEDE